jgi:hypothetical protein
MIIIVLIILFAAAAILASLGGIYLFLQDKIFGYSPSKLIRSIPFMLSGLFLLICILLILYKIFWSGVSLSRDGGHNFSGNNPRLAKISGHEQNSSFLQQNEEIDMFIRMIFSTYYVDGDYKGYNYRSEGKPYIDFFNKEYMELRQLDPDNGRIIRDDDKSFTDGRILFIWRLYMRYMDTRFNLGRVIRKLDEYMAFLRERHLVKMADRGPLYNVFTIQSFSSCCTAFVAIFKLLSRKLIPQKAGINILHHLRKLMYLHKDLYPEIVSEEGFTESIVDLVRRLNKEIEEKGNYRPVRLLHSNDIFFIQTSSRIPIFFGEGRE